MDEKKELESLKSDPKDDLDKVALESSLIVLLSGIQNMHQFRSISNTIDIVSFTLSQANNIRGELKYNSSENDNVNQAILKDLSISTVNLAANKYLQNTANKVALRVAGDVAENYATNYAVEEAMKMANKAVVLAKNKKGSKVTTDFLRRTYQKSFSKWFKIFKQRAINGSGKQLGKHAGKMTSKSMKYIPVYAIYKLVDGARNYLTLSHDRENFIKQFDNEEGLSEIEKRYAYLTQKEKKSDDFEMNVSNNVLALGADCFTLGYGGDVVRYLTNKSVSRNATHRLEMDNKYFMKDINYTNERTAGIAFSDSKKSMSLKTSLDLMQEELEILRKETNMSDELYYDISTIMSMNTQIGDYDRHKDRVKYLRLLMNKHPNRDPRDLVKIVLNSESELYQWFQSKTPEEILEKNLLLYDDARRAKEGKTLEMLKLEYPAIHEEMLRSILLNSKDEIDYRLFVEEDERIQKEHTHSLNHKFDTNTYSYIQKSKSEDEIIKEVIAEKVVAVSNDPMINELYMEKKYTNSLDKEEHKIKTMTSNNIINGIQSVSEKIDVYYDQFIDSFTNGIKNCQLTQ